MHWKRSHRLPPMWMDIPAPKASHIRKDGGLGVVKAKVC